MIHSQSVDGRQIRFDYTFDYLLMPVESSGRPYGYPTIVEIMTSSTSGGNKRKRTTISAAFEDAILREPHTGPGINYRQVWARMVSQLIVKSEVAIAWGGKTIWALQDRLVDYISTSTALNIKSFLSRHTDEVNILAFSHRDSLIADGNPRKGGRASLYAGPIGQSDEPEFRDIVRTPVCPPKSALLRLLERRPPTRRITIPSYGQG
jgi:hypothetical protein